jgi:hypothetical protein
MEYYCQWHLSQYSDSLEAGPYLLCLLAETKDLLSIQNIRPALGTSGLLFSGCCGSFSSVEAADYLYFLLRLQMSAVVTVLMVNVFMVYRGTALPFTVVLWE